MGKVYTIPNTETIARLVKATPIHMWPHSMPEAVVAETLLTPIECIEIIRQFSVIEPYQFPGCGASETIEGTRPMRSCLAKIREFGLAVNHNYFNFQIDTDVSTWLQTYREGNHYQMHKDAFTGQTRKLTVVCLLSDWDNYAGGELELFFGPNSEGIVPYQGTCVAFPAWQMHEVREVRAGKRQSLNMGFYGPPFR